MKAKNKTKTVPAKAPVAVKASPAVNVAAAVKEAKAPPKALAIVPVLKAGALSKDIGPMVIAGLDKTYRDEAKANELMEGVKAKRYDLLSHTTLAIVKAAKADNNIKLATAFADDKEGMLLLNNQIGIALGYREVVTMGEGDKARDRVVYARAVERYFPSAKDAKDSPEAKRKATLRSNFIHMVKKCAMTAAGIIEKDMTAAMDKESGTLRLSGPAVKKQFGAGSVLLNEKQTVGEGDKAIKLTEKPSFTAIAAKAAESHGKIVHRASNTRGRQLNVSPEDAVSGLCKSLIAAIERIGGKITDTVKTSLESVVSAIDKALDATEAKA